MDKKLFQQQAQRAGVKLSDAQLNQFALYHKELLSWNVKINLISRKSTQEITSRHFMDSLSVVRFIDRPNARILDIGSGGGFPGIPLKIAIPALEMHLLESNRKKTSFLKHIIRQLKLAGAQVIHERAQKATEDKKRLEYYDYVVSRAAFHLADLAMLSAPFLTPKGKFIAMKGEDVESEVIHCGNNATVAKSFELIQYNIDLYPQGKNSIIIVGKKLKKGKKIF